MAIALSELQRRFYDRMDEGQSQYVSTQQATDLINEAYSQLWGIYVDRAPVYMETDYSFQSVANQRDYPLPSDFRRAVKLYRVVNNCYYPMRTTERERYMRNTWGQFHPDYQLLGANIRINHTPTDGLATYELWYIPHYTPLVNPLNVIDPRIFPGHEQWIITQAVIALKVGKEEQPADDLIAMNDRLKAQIENDLIMRDMGESTHVVMQPRYEWYEDPWFLSASGVTSIVQTGSSQSTSTTSTSSSTTSTSSGTSSSSSGSTGSTSSGSSGSTSSSSSTTSSTTTGAPTLSYVYQNGSQNGWQNNNNYGGTFQVASDSRTTGGVSIEGALAQYGGFNFGSLNGSNINVNNYLGLQFDAYSATGAPVIRVQLDPGNNQSPIVSEYFTLSTGWNTYTMLYTDIGATNSSSTTSTFTNVEFVNLSATTTPNIFLNNIALLVNPSPPVATYTLVATDASPAATTSGWLHVKGNQFYDANGNIWMGHGVNTPETRLAGKAYSITPQTGVVPELTRRLQWAINQGVDMFRLDLDQRNSSDDLVNNADYLTAIKQVVNFIGSKGCHVMISLQNDWTASPFGNGQSGQPTVATLTHISALASAFRNSGHVMFGFCNEPRSNDTPALLSAYTAITNQCISVVRQIEARDGAPFPHICVVQGSSSYSRNIPYFVSNPNTDSYYPITSSTSVGYIAYEVHVYEAASYWQAEFESSAVSIPLIVGEFGPNDPNGTMLLNGTQDDVTPFMSYCQSKNIPYIAWALDYNDPPDMLINNATDGSYGVGMTLQWSQPWGLTYANNMRANKGLTGTVDVYGNISTGGSTNTGTSSSSSGSSGSSSSSSSSSSSGSYTSTYVFQNGLVSANSWGDNSYTGTYGTATDSRVTGGVAKTALIQQYGAVNFTHSALTASNYKGIRFDAYAGSGAPSIRVQIDSNNSGSPIVYEVFTIGSSWATYTFLFTDTGAVGTATGTFTNIEIVNTAAATTPTIYFNNVCLLS